jgi:hypothetical protein
MRASRKHLLLHLPEEWTTDQRGQFFEGFVSDLLRPMRFEVRERLRVTGMEIDLLAKGLDQPRTILVECKAQRDPLPADTISKLLGNVALRRADAGWLFSASDLTKDGRGQWEEIQGRADLAAKFTWYPPERLIDILVDQNTVVDPELALAQHAPSSADFGDATLVWSAHGRHWLVEILQDGLPTFFAVLDGSTGAPLAEDQAIRVAGISDRFSTLEFQEVRAGSLLLQKSSVRSPIARVVSGDAWEDLRPARPADFVGRDDVIQGILSFVNDVRERRTSTRTFAVQGPSGWGKSSLVLKIADVVRIGRRISRCSLTAVDSRSATSAAFVTGALRLAFTDAVAGDLIPTTLSYDIGGLTHPLDSGDLLKAAAHLAATEAVIVLIFDQFEELFTKESLFETFNAIRDLSMDLDSRQIPVVLGFAWKTDVSLPQQHPAYHLWHSLADRRRDFRLRQFGSPDISRVISHAQRQIGVQLVPALRTRLMEQCQGYPWLLKKLLVHVAHRLTTTSSQYALLERELDVEALFKEDLAGLKPEQIRCLKYVAERAPAYVSEVEQYFSPDLTNSLLSKRLLVRSGLNYAVYWDIFRDYLIEGRAPQIPWARTFQRDPRSAMRAVQVVAKEGTSSAVRLSEALGGSERGWVNVMSDLVALQIVDRVADDSYRLASHIKVTAPLDLAGHIHTQLARHVVCRELALMDRDSIIGHDTLDKIVEKTRPATTLSEQVVHQYAMNLKRWLLFSGHLEERGAFLYRPIGRGAQMGVVRGPRNKTVKFLGCATPDSLVALLKYLWTVRKSGACEGELVQRGMRNAMYDAVALQLVNRSQDRKATLAAHLREPKAFESAIKREILRQQGIVIVAAALQNTPDITNLALGEVLRSGLKQDWKPTSALRYANGIKRYYEWTSVR